MSKLKAFYMPRYAGAFTMHEVYLKSEADKVIAELKKACNDKDDWCLHTLKENRHQKYKRCLAMARWCDASMAYFGEFYDDASKQMVTHYYKWRKRWLELAEKFKPEKVRIRCRA